MIHQTLDTLPPLTEKQRKHLDKLSKKPESEINTGDIPELTDDQLSEMRRPGDDDTAFLQSYT